MGEFTRVALAVAAKDLRLELRTRATILSAVIFAALVLVVFNFSRDPTAVAAIDLAPGVLWVTVAFASVVALNRAFTVEREHAALDGLRLAPAPGVRPPHRSGHGPAGGALLRTAGGHGGLGASPHPLPLLHRLRRGGHPPVRDGGEDPLRRADAPRRRLA